jgi:hypothetical protein
VDVLVQVNGVLTSDNVVDGRTLGTLGFLGHFLKDQSNEMGLQGEFQDLFVDSYVDTQILNEG